MINDDEIHIWIVSDHSDNIFKLRDKLDYLSADEVQKKSRFYFDYLKNQFVITRLLVREVFSYYHNTVKQNEWIFCKNKYGKPIIKNQVPSLLEFNISHTRGFITLAVTKKGKIGIDIERIDPMINVMKFASRNFSAIEINDLFNLPDGMQKSRFYELWTLKEAYVKAMGIGLSIGLDQFSFTFEHGSPLVSFHNDNLDLSENWKFWFYHLQSGSKIAIAKNDPSRIEDYTLQFYYGFPGCHKPISVNYL